VIRLSNVRKKFGQRLAVDGFSLEVSKGEIFGLLGTTAPARARPSGMMLGQVWPTQGEVLICGHDVTRRRQLALQRVGATLKRLCSTIISAAGGTWRS